MVAQLRRQQQSPRGQTVDKRPAKQNRTEGFSGGSRECYFCGNKEHHLAVCQKWKDWVKEDPSHRRALCAKCHNGKHSARSCKVARGPHWAVEPSAVVALVLDRSVLTSRAEPSPTPSDTPSDISRAPTPPQWYRGPSPPRPEVRETRPRTVEVEPTPKRAPELTGLAAAKYKAARLREIALKHQLAQAAKEREELSKARAQRPAAEPQQLPRATAEPVARSAPTVTEPVAQPQQQGATEPVAQPPRHMAQVSGSF